MKQIEIARRRRAIMRLHGKCWRCGEKKCECRALLRFADNFRRRLRASFGWCPNDGRDTYGYHTCPPCRQRHAERQAAYQHSPSYVARKFELALSTYELFDRDSPAQAGSITWHQARHKRRSR